MKRFNIVNNYVMGIIKVDDVEIFKDVYDDMRMSVCLECQYSPNGLKMTPENAGVFDKEYNEIIEYEFSYK